MLQELDSVDALQTLITSHANVCVTFSAHWCGPCNRSKPALQALAAKYHADAAVDLHMAIIYENVLGDTIHQYNVTAFPTYILFQRGGVETNRVQGANLAAVQEMILAGQCGRAAFGGVSSSSAGAILGGGAGGGGAVSPADARAARLAKLGGGTSTTTTTSNTTEPMDVTDTDKVVTEAPTKDATDKDVTMMQQDDDDDDDDEKPNETAEQDPTAKLDPTMIQTLTESMGFSLLRAQKGLLYGNGGTVEAAVEWLMQHQDDDDIDDPIPLGPVQKAQSYKCNECGKILSNMANLELHANKTGHSDFEESTQSVTPLTEEEKKAKIAEIKELLRLKRAEREEAEKVDDVTREKQRRNMGKEMIKTREQMEMEARKREAQQRKREKEAFKKERARLRAELAKDKAERQANAGKLQSRLGVEGYQPDGIQYDVPGEGMEEEDAAAPAAKRDPKKFKADASKIDEYIKKVSSYRAGGDGGKCLKILKIYVSNVVDNPDDPKFKSINTENKAFKTKVKPFIGGKQLLMAVGFLPNETGDALNMSDEHYNAGLLAETKAKLEAAMVAYG